MARAVVFKTPGLIDIRAFTTFGVNAKPNSENPIGYFGTGLKFAIAVLVRNKLKVTLWVGDTRYSFYQKEGKFRDKDFDFVRMKKETGFLSKIRTQYSELPFATTLGRNWELWMAFRELYSNTLDEGGETFITNQGAELKGIYPNETHIMVEGEPFVDCFLDKDKHFLPDGLTTREGTADVQILDRPSDHVYYRGMRVMDLKEGSLFTYNILRQMELTEDRTLKFNYQAEQVIADAVKASEDTGQIEKVLKAPKKSLEGSLNWGYSYGAPGPTFRERAIALHSSVESATLKQEVELWKPQKAEPDQFAKWPRPWSVTADGDIDLIKNAHDQTLAKVVGGGLAELIVATINKGYISPDTEIPF